MQIRQKYSKKLLKTFQSSRYWNGNVVFTCSGTEANDLALRIAAAHNPEASVVICMEGGYHGHSLSLISVSPYKYSGSGGRGRSTSVIEIELPRYGKSIEQCLEQLHGRCTSAMQRGQSIQAFIYESISGCGGQYFYPDGFLEACEKIARRFGAVCICDEIQTGVGRTGERTMWAFESQNVTPDIVTMGKPLGNGFPLAAVVATKVRNRSPVSTVDLSAIRMTQKSALNRCKWPVAGRYRSFRKHWNGVLQHLWWQSRGHGDWPRRFGSVR